MSNDQPLLPLPLLPLTRKEQKLLSANSELVNDPPGIEQADFLHAVLCQVGMPRSKTNAREFERRTGKAILSIEAGKLFNGREFVPQPLPYGSRPRLIMVHVSTYAVRHKSRDIPVGNSIRDYMNTLGLDDGGHEYHSFRRQILALAACRMTLGYVREGRAVTVKTEPFEQFDAWLNGHRDQQTLWPGHIELSGRFYETMLEFAVPLAATALRALKGSSLALDVYSWLAHRLLRLRKPAFIPWPALKEQFGQEYTASKDFKREFVRALGQVLAVYPDAKVEPVQGGLLLGPSPPPIPKTQIAVRLPNPGL